MHEGRKPYTDKQRQYLAFIYLYTKLHRQAPVEFDMQSYFGVTPPSVHQMVLTLHANGFIDRIPGRARSIGCCSPRKRCLSWIYRAHTAPRLIEAEECGCIFRKNFAVSEKARLKAACRQDWRSYPLLGYGCRRRR